VCPIRFAFIFTRSLLLRQEVSLNLSKLIRQTHRWLSMAFTVAVINNIIAIAQKVHELVGPIGRGSARLAVFHGSVLVCTAICHQAA
jgi:hypothetical protein